MIDKAPDAYRTISEVGEELDLPQHVLRFWETRFSQIRPLKRGGGRRYYRPDDVDLLKGIRHLLYSEGYTIKGVQRILKEHGPKAVQAFAAGESPAGAAYAPAPQPGEMGDDFGGGTDDFGSDGHEADAPAADEHAAAGYGDQPHPAPRFVAPLPQGAPLVAPAAPPVAARPPAVQPAPDLFEPAPAPVAPASARAPSLPTVSFTRGGLLKPQISPAPAREAAPLPVLPIRKPLMPIVEREEPGDSAVPLAAEVAPAAAPPPGGLGEHSRRALQAALVELTDCRRVIERVIAGRDRSANP